MHEQTCLLVRTKIADRNLIMITYKQHQDYALTLSSSTSHLYDAHLYISNDVLTICMLGFFHAFLFAIRPDL